ncbi:MAG: glycine cleavage T C-terminal barrel domain-containing protein, partial [Burkholderiaceae bacterium]
TPWEAGLALAVKLDKPAPFIGRDALLAAREKAPRKKLVSVVFDDPSVYAWGGEAVHLDGEPVGELSSAGWSLAAGACAGLGYVRGAAAQQAHGGTPVTVDLWGEAVAAKLWDRAPRDRGA